MKDFDIVKYLKENKQGAYGMFNGYVDLKPLKEEEQLDGDNTWMEDVDGTDAYTVGEWKCYYDSPGVLVWSYGDVPFSELKVSATPDGVGETAIDVEINEAPADTMLLKKGAFANFDEYAKAMMPFLNKIENGVKTLKEEEESTPAEDDSELDPDTVPYEAEEDQLTGLGDEDSFEQDDIVSEAMDDNRIEGLINRTDLRNLQSAAVNIFDELTDDGFEAEEVAEYLVDQIKQASAPYKHNAGALSENEEEYPDYTRIMDLGGERIEQGIISLLDDGFSEEDILELCQMFVKDHANARAQGKNF